MTPEKDRRDAPLSCARAQVLLEAFLDSDLAPARQQRFLAHVEGCAACRTELEAARRVQEGLRALPRWSCPPSVAERVMAQVGAADASFRVPWRERLAGWRQGWQGLWRPVCAGASVAVTALLIALLARQPPPPSPETVALQKAEEEVRWALAYVAQVTARASDEALESTVGEVVGNVIGERVVAPVTNAVSRPLKEDRQP